MCNIKYITKLDWNEAYLRNDVFFLQLLEGEAVTHNITPALVERPSKLVFGDIEEIQLIPDLNIAIIRKYSVMDCFKSALTELVDLIFKYPEILLYSDYCYLYDFFIRFGVTSEAITHEVYKTQLRRAKAQFPASTLLVKQEQLEVPTSSGEEINSSETETEERHLKQQNNESELGRTRYCQRKLRFRKGSNLSGGDSGIGSLGHSSSNSSDVDIRPKEEKESNALIITDFKCPLCPKVFRTRWRYTRHIAKEHQNVILIPQKTLRKISKKPAAELFHCITCRQDFQREIWYQKHMVRFHSDDLHSLQISNPRKNKHRKKMKQEVITDTFPSKKRGSSRKGSNSKSKEKCKKINRTWDMIKTECISSPKKSKRKCKKRCRKESKTSHIVKTEHTSSPKHSKRKCKKKCYKASYESQPKKRTSRTSKGLRSTDMQVELVDGSQSLLTSFFSPVSVPSESNVSHIGF